MQPDYYGMVIADLRRRRALVQAAIDALEALRPVCVIHLSPATYELVARSADHSEVGGSNPPEFTKECTHP